jgi:nucleotide-binding universal stress UspA family protein
MTFTKILCPTDFSEGSRQAMRVAVHLAKETKAELVFAHAWYVPPSMYAGEYVFPPAVLGQMADDAQRELDGVVKQAMADGAKRVSATLVTGVPWVELVELLEKQAFDLCVMATHGRTGLPRIMLGSVAEKVVRHAPCSVLAVRPDSEPRPFTHVLVPTDFSPSAKSALELAAELVRPGGAGVTVLHVIEVPVAYSGELRVADFARDLDTRSSEALAKAAEHVKRRASVPVSTTSRIGYPGAETLAALDADPSIDLVIMGSHGRTGIKRALLGSVAEKVIRHARCPVLVARNRP